mgnify:CR=1 FL=1
MQNDKNQEDTMLEEKTKKDWLWSFSKKIVFFVCIIFTIAFLGGIGVSIYALVKLQDYSMAVTVFTESCSIFRDMIISYCVKAGVENYQKIKKTF